MLVERAAGEPGLFERRRAVRAEQEKLAAPEAGERRLPQAESLLAAVVAEPDLYEGLRYRLRDDITVIDYFGRQVPGAVAARVYEPENLVALFLCVSRIVEHGGRDIVIDEHGNLGHGLPPLPRGSLAQLRLNGWLTTSQDGAGTRVGLGERTRAIAATWGIDLPPADNRWTGDGMKINEQALAALLHSREGPVGRLVEHKAQEVTAAARRNAAVIMHRQPSVVSAINYQMVSGTEAVVGIRDEGSISEYLAAKAVREGEQGWLHQAVTEVFPGQSRRRSGRPFAVLTRR